MRPHGLPTGLVIGVALPLAVGLLIWVWVYISLPPGSAMDGQLGVAGLEAPLRIVRDPFGVPHIQARSERDAFLALGLVHAQDRFWQMELMRRSARGELSELFGVTTLEEDRLARTLGLGRDADAEGRTLTQSVRLQLEAYAAGVNLYLERMDAEMGPVPIELRRLRLDPEPWSPSDTLALVRLRAWQLSSSLGASLLLDRLVRTVGGVESQDLFPVRPIDATPALIGSLLRLGGSADAWASVVGLRGPVGSLGFIVGGRRTRGGQPILANDPHVEFRAPPLFYAAHLSTPERELAGGTWPGVPVFWTGTNRSIAWGGVVLHASVTDLYQETLHPQDPYRYAQGSHWRDVERYVESIAVRGAEDEPIEILETRNGPLLGSIHPDEEPLRSLALRWAGQHRRSGIEALLRLQEVTTWDEFRHVLRRYPAPPTNFLYADRKGNLGVQLAGNLPLRAIETGLLPVPGSDRYYRWRGFIPFKDLPYRYGAAIPWLIASTHPEDFKLPQSVVWLWRPGGAPERLRELLEDARRIEMRDVLAIQRDRRSVRGTRRVRQLLEGIEPSSGPAKRVRALLLEWDGRTDTQARGVSVYHVFRQRLARLLLRANLGEEVAAELAEVNEPLPGVLLARFVDRAGASADARALVEQALEETWTTLGIEVSSNPGKWTWGRLHRLRLRHDFERLGTGRLRWLGRRLGRGPFPVAGDADSPWTMHHRTLPTNEVGVGPGFRYAVDLADVDHARWGLAGGQSGHAGSERYDDALAEWLRGRPRPLWMHASDIRYHEAGVWELEPLAE